MKVKKKIQVLNQKVQKLRKQLTTATTMGDETAEIERLQRELAKAEADLEKLKRAAGG